MSKKIQILIVEDNVIIALDLKSLLENFGYEVVGYATNYEKAVKFLDSKSIDLVLLDIGLSSSKNGIDVADYINENIKIPFIFLTSNSDDDTILKASKRRPYSYLVKPFNKDTIHASIELALNDFSSQNKKTDDTFFVKKNNMFHKIRLKDLAFIKSDNIYLELHCYDKNKFLIRSTLKKFLEKLPNNFLQCHKSYIVNYNYINSFNSKSLIINEEEIPISSKFKDNLNKNKL